MTETADSRAADLFTRLVTVPDGYRRSCRLLGLSANPATVLGGCYSLAATGGLLGLIVLSVAPGATAVVGGTALLTGGAGVALLGRYGIGVAAQAKRIRALGVAPSLVAMLVLGMTLWPNAERATVFATTEDDGLLVDSLDTHRRRATHSARSGLRTFANEWAGQFPALTEAIARLERAATVPAAEREQVLEAARDRILEGTHDEMARFAADLRGPATALYAFGVLLPLAMVALLPAATGAGIPVTPSLLVATYGIVLPGGLVVASLWLLAQRPVAFPPTTVPRTHPDVPSSPLPALASGVAVAACVWLVSPVVVPKWGQPLSALGGGTGTALLVHYRPVTRVRAHVDALEASVPDALSSVGMLVARGESVEAAITQTVETTPDPLAQLLDETVRRQQTLGVDIETAFCGHHGSISTIPSPRLRRVAVLLGAAADIGPPAGDTITTMGAHLDALSAVERETRRELAQVTGTLSNTAALFGPLVGGATVALAGAIQQNGPIEPLPASTLGPVVGWYCFVLAAVLTALSTGLHRGIDRALVGYKVGLALCSATTVYLTAVVATGLLV